MTELARDKIQEAEFFLEEMKETTDSEDFRFYLSAFLSASWAIFDLLGTEWSSKDEFEEWYSEEKTRFKTNPFLKFMWRARNGVCHYGRPQTWQGVEVFSRSTTAVSIANKSGKEESFSVFYGQESSEMYVDKGKAATIEFYLAEKSVPDIEVDAPSYFEGSVVDAPLPEEYSHVPITEVCEEYLEELRSMVRSAETTFEFI